MQTLSAIRLGYRAIDTAAQPQHYAEAAVGDALARAVEEGLVSRDEIFLQTKFTPLKWQVKSPPPPPNSSLMAHTPILPYITGPYTTGPYPTGPHLTDTPPPPPFSCRIRKGRCPTHRS